MTDIKSVSSLTDPVLTEAITQVTQTIPDVGNIMGEYARPHFDLPLLNGVLSSSVGHYRPGFDTYVLYGRALQDKKIANFYKGYGVDFQGLHDHVNREIGGKYDRALLRYMELNKDNKNIVGPNDALYILRDLPGVEDIIEKGREKANMETKGLDNLREKLANIPIVEDVREIWIESDCTNGRCQITTRIRVAPIEGKYTIQSFMNALVEVFQKSGVSFANMPREGVFQIDPKSLTYANGVLRMKAGIYDITQ